MFTIFYVSCSGRGSLEVRERRKVNIKLWDWFMRTIRGLYDCSELSKKLCATRHWREFIIASGAKWRHRSVVIPSPLFSPSRHTCALDCAVLCAFSAYVLINIDFGEGLQIRRVTLGPVQTSHRTCLISCGFNDKFCFSVTVFFFFAFFTGFGKRRRR